MCFLAEVEGRVVGWAAWCCSGSRRYPKAPSAWRVTSLNTLTLAGFRGKGIASAIMGELLACAREAGAGLVALKATDAGRRVYEKFGFVENRAICS